MRRYFALAVVWLSLAAVASAQVYEPRSESVIRPAGYGWRNHVVVPDGPCGCGVPVRTDCYDKCCVRCGLRPICFLQRVGRMLDCLLPCNTCCGLLGGPGCCGGGGPIGCATPVGHPSYRPSYGDPFLDDPLPTPSFPTPSPASEVRRESPRPLHHPSPTRVAPAPSPSPWKITHGPAEPSPPPSRDLQASTQRPTSAAAQHAVTLHAPAPHSVLRRASAEEPIAPGLHNVDTARALPIVRSQSPAASEPKAEAIPHNPLRSK